MGHLLKNTSGQFIEFEMRNASGNLITTTGGLVVLVAISNATGYSSGSGSIGVINDKRLTYIPHIDETLGTMLRLEASHTGALVDYYDTFIMTPSINTLRQVSISNILPNVDVSGYVTINNALPTVVSGNVSLNEELPTVDVSGRVTISNTLPTVVSGNVTINNTLPVLDGNRYVTINNALPSVHATGSVFTHGLPSLPQIKLQVVDAISGDIYNKPGYGTPPDSTGLAYMVAMTFKAVTNKSEQNAGQFSLYDNSGVTVHQKALCTDDSVTFTRNKLTAG